MQPPSSYARVFHARISNTQHTRATHSYAQIAARKADANAARAKRHEPSARAQTQARVRKLRHACANSGTRRARTRAHAHELLHLTRCLSSLPADARLAPRDGLRHFAPSVEKAVGVRPRTRRLHLQGEFLRMHASPGEVRLGGVLPRRRVPLRAASKPGRKQLL
eukprot:6186849-Pleurochrysis_carterae.AAC.3